jgi:2-amino-4-hydroxy-6-hydroxymethyldihydropteridine diphosphokinase
MRSSPTVFLGLGSNVGPREENLGRGLRLLEDHGFQVTSRSSLYETEPVGGPPQGPFLNMVASGKTSKEPEELLALCLETERALGRVRREPSGPRTLDVDILLMGDLVRSDPDLTIPHPGLHERLFVLVPLAEIAPAALRHPILGLSATEMLERCEDRHKVVLHQAAGAGA